MAAKESIKTDSDLLGTTKEEEEEEKEEAKEAAVGGCEISGGGAKVVAMRTAGSGGERVEAASSVAGAMGGFDWGEGSRETAGLKNNEKVSSCWRMRDGEDRWKASPGDCRADGSADDDHVVVV